MKTKHQLRKILLGFPSLALMLLVVIQVILSGRVATNGWRIKDLEFRKERLVSENQRLENEIQKNSAIAAISVKAQTLGLKLSPKNILYLSLRELFAQKTP